MTERERIRQMAGWAEQDVLAHLLYNYDTDARGVISSNDTVTVAIQLLLLRIQGLVRVTSLGSFLKIKRHGTDRYRQNDASQYA